MPDVDELKEAADLIVSLREGTNNLLTVVLGGGDGFAATANALAQENYRVVQELCSHWPHVTEALKAQPSPPASGAKPAARDQNGSAGPPQPCMFSAARAAYEVAVTAHLGGELHANKASGHNHPPATELKFVLERVRPLMPKVDIQTFKGSTGQLCPVASADEVRLVCEGNFCAIIVLSAPGAADPARVVFETTEKKPEIDGWGAPQHQVHRRLSGLAIRALGYFRLRGPLVIQEGGVPNSTADSAALEDLLLWIGLHQHLFSDKCRSSGKFLLWDPSTGQPCPPLFQPFKLSRRELVAALHARTSLLCHLQDAPAQVLAWELPAAASKKYNAQQLHSDASKGGAYVTDGIDAVMNGA